MHPSSSAAEEREGQQKTDEESDGLGSIRQAEQPDGLNLDQTQRQTTGRTHGLFMIADDAEASKYSGVLSDQT